MPKLSPNSTLMFAKELTYKAIENNYISISTESKETAKNIADFYQTLVSNINEELEVE